MSGSAPQRRRRILRRGVPAAVLAALVLAGCGGSGGGGDTSGTAQQPAGTPASGAPPQVIVQTAGSGFDAARVYREAAPGVVTIRSVFGGRNTRRRRAPASCSTGMVRSSPTLTS